ncbi:MAG TPA: hypothetical protein VJM10_01080, partial [Candidatus Methylomirabilis sp.]|nr:hypothetical protein [Candidatus Methylomirabilis sp.]
MGNELVQIALAGQPQNPTAYQTQADPPSAQVKTFYIETFGCQMNVHDSEKVAGLLVARGYLPVDR